MQEPGRVLQIPATAKIGFQLIQPQFQIDPEDEGMDVFTTLYEPDVSPLIKPQSEVEDRGWYQAVQSYLQTARYESIHQNTVLDHELCGAATVPLLKELIESARQWQELEEEREQAEQEGDTEAIEQLERRATLQRVQTTQRILAAMSEAESAIETVQALRMLGAGTDAGQYVSVQLTSEHFRQVMDIVRRTAAHFGRLRTAWMEAKTKIPSDAFLVKGVKVARQIRSLLPQELLLLADPDLELLFLLKYLQQRLLVYDVERPIRQQRGDVVVCVDESGSMLGEPVLIAKAFAFLLRQMLDQEGRRCTILSFSYQDEDTVVVPYDAPASQVAEWLARAIAGGTSFDTALRRAMEIARDQSLRSPDIVILSDGEDTVGDSVRAQVLQFKRDTGARLFFLHFGRQPSGLWQVADHILHIEDIDQFVASLQQLSANVEGEGGD